MNLKFKLPPSSMELNFKIDKIAPPQPIRELTGALPLVFTSIGAPLIDWRIKGAAGGVGNRGINYLKQEEKTLPDGGYGIRINSPTWQSGRTLTFNSGAANGIGIAFRKTGYADIVPSDVGTITISAANLSDIVISDIYQGGISTEDVGSSDGRYAVGYGDDGSGRTIIYNDDNTRYISIQCKTLPVALVENTDYTITRTGGIEDVDIMYTLTKDRGDISIYWGSPTVNSIPGNTTANKNTEQWTQVDTDYARINAYGANTQIDSHPAKYENCAYYADLPVGHWKVVAECLNNDFTNSAIVDDTTPYMALIAEDGTEIISKTNLFQSRSVYFNHEEYDFVLSDDTKVGLYFKALHRDGYPAYVRFMIVNYDVEAVAFTANVYQDNPITGVTCWEPYHHTIPVTVTSGSTSTTIDIVVIDALGANDFIDFSTTNISIPTYSGINTITFGTDVQPSEIYIKYRKF